MLLSEHSFDNLACMFLIAFQIRMEKTNVEAQRKICLTLIYYRQFKVFFIISTVKWLSCLILAESSNSIGKIRNRVQDNLQLLFEFLSCYIDNPSNFNPLSVQSSVLTWLSLLGQMGHTKMKDEFSHLSLCWILKDLLWLNLQCAYFCVITCFYVV